MFTMFSNEVDPPQKYARIKATKPPYHSMKNILFFTLNVVILISMAVSLLIPASGYSCLDNSLPPAPEQVVTAEK